MTNAGYEYWTTDTETTSKIPQSSDPSVIAAMVELADIKPGMNVMEIGTGSGYTAAILADEVTPSGRVVSLDIEEKLTTRAAALHHQVGNTHVEFHHTNGVDGWKHGAPYDRILGWTSPQVLPARWLQQSAQNALIVTPINIAGLAGINAVIQCRVNDGKPGDAAAHPGSFIEMTDEPTVDFAQPPSLANAVITQKNGTEAWISVGRHNNQVGSVEALVRRLTEAEPEPQWLVQKDWRNFAAYIVGSNTACTQISVSTGKRLGIGLADSSSAAAVLGDGSLITYGTTSAAILDQLRNAWGQAGKPGYESATVSFTATAEGWQPQLSL